MIQLICISFEYVIGFDQKKCNEEIYELTKLCMFLLFLTFGDARKIFSINAIPKKPVPPVMNTPLFVKNSATFVVIF